MVRGSFETTGSGEALAWARSSLRWARERDKERLEALLEAVVDDLLIEEENRPGYRSR